MSKGRTKPAEPDPEDDGEKPAGKKTSLKVGIEDGRVVAKVAAMRNLSMEELFMEKDVRTFFKHLLLAEMKKEAERLGGQP